MTRPYPQISWHVKRRHLEGQLVAVRAEILRLKHALAHATLRQAVGKPTARAIGQVEGAHAMRDLCISAVVVPEGGLLGDDYARGWIDCLDAYRSIMSDMMLTDEALRVHMEAK